MSYWNIKGKGVEWKLFSVLFCKADHREAGMIWRRYFKKMVEKEVIHLFCLLSVYLKCVWRKKGKCHELQRSSVYASLLHLEWRLWCSRTAYYKIKDTAQCCFLFVLKQGGMLITKLINLILKNKSPVDHTRCLNDDEPASWECAEARIIFTTLRF